MSLKLLTIVAAAALALTACESSQQNTGATTGTTQTTTAAPSGPVAGSQEALTQQVGDRIFFDFDKSDIRADQRGTVDKLAAWLKQNPSVQLTIEGNCDERGTREYNLALGERRANAVQEYLVARGVNASRLKTISYGKERPAVLGSTEYAWAQNRRDQFVVR
ncbi:peptidoglycan-associated lipoprotein [Tistlia consotensis]|uniref:Peptidoglycan-associated lipoprotein n=1 Tax=Tistlia consotensis USBA 355 TaxID=560819 RepID=A0A1Y6C2M9_9PROT|nr:peptidoglycan-associated lipoprotein Pal [Tistlia consotensis]SMF32664.1 peptidoglycan-associated lipoprotein [Tistlia consotensis USBA 355]SNR68780.1 peptidoglycan-associated lipoprotein [Tistlia consotensis]